MVRGDGIPEESDGHLRQGVVRRYAFVKRRRGQWPVRLDVPGPAHLRQRLLQTGGEGHRAAGRPATTPWSSQSKANHDEVKSRYGSPRISGK